MESLSIKIRQTQSGSANRLLFIAALLFSRLAAAKRKEDEREGLDIRIQIGDELLKLASDWKEAMSRRCTARGPSVGKSLFLL